jgi:hypothetical protein
MSSVSRDVAWLVSGNRRSPVFNRFVLGVSQVGSSCASLRASAQTVLLALCRMSGCNVAGRCDHVAEEPDVRDGTDTTGHGVTALARVAAASVSTSVLGSWLRPRRPGRDGGAVPVAHPLRFGGLRGTGWCGSLRGPARAGPGRPPTSRARPWRPHDRAPGCQRGMAPSTGRALSGTRLFTEDGATVFIAGRNPERGHALGRERTSPSSTSSTRCSGTQPSPGSRSGPAVCIRCWISRVERLRPRRRGEAPDTAESLSYA